MQRLLGKKLTRAESIHKKSWSSDCSRLRLDKQGSKWLATAKVLAPAALCNVDGYLHVTTMHAEKHVAKQELEEELVKMYRDIERLLEDA